ncbi:MAG: metallophosphoesterase [Thermoprotei archaeon]
MLLLVVSDIHGNLRALNKIVKAVAGKKVDAVIVAGDVTDFGTGENAIQTLNILKDVNKKIFYVPGNCDYVDTFDIKELEEMNIHGKHAKINDLFVVGVGGSVETPFSTPFELGEEEIDSLLEKAYRSAKQPKNFILVSHTPPYNTRLDLTYSGLHTGSKTVRAFIEEHKPMLVVCGHIHEARGTDKLGESLMVNPGPARKGYYALVSIEKSHEIEIFLGEA